MYTPKHYEVKDFEEIIEFIQKNSFGTIVSTNQGKPLATHVPLELHKKGSDYYITGHLAYANSQWKTFNENNEQVLVIYQGPHAYISSSWYKTEDVPTWNYQAVHVYGTVSLMDEEELEEDLIRLLHKYESHRQNPVLWKNFSSQTKRQIKGIVGFKIKLEEVQAAYKLSQNRSEKDYEAIIKNLYEEEKVNSNQLAQLMDEKNK
ncbi:FMN-binding negative transcriptional regulator [Alkalibacillus silvisoli]|uniref:Protease synthase/sporulation negative transcriptional regulator PaiB n=1 Tax=Alkalibacillus silvisoli TaxID=392823 RepID=A0ABN0ZPP8_9BACI